MLYTHKPIDERQNSINVKMELFNAVCWLIGSKLDT